MEYANGTHILGRISTAEDFRPRTIKWYRRRMIAIIRRNGLTVLTSTFHRFKGGGFTGAIVLGESHVTLHTWFERSYVDMDVYVCNVTRDNRHACFQVFGTIATLFEPLRTDMQEIHR